MRDRIQQFEEALRQAGHRMTVQRRAICAYLATTDTHPTPSAVYESLAPDHPEISRATVYNTLHVLQQLGAIIQIDLGDEHTHYETNLQPHVNLVCRRCHGVIDYSSASLPDEFLTNVQRTASFQASAVQVQVFGLCAACQAATMPPA
jgi:Fur family peroxide stress response transcriptional regulator